MSIKFQNDLPMLVIFDMSITHRSPAGSCVLSEINALMSFYNICVISSELQINHPDRVKWLRVPLPRGPVLLRYILFHFMGPIFYAFCRARGCQPDIAQSTQGQFPIAEISYAHFCHRAYIRNKWKDSSVRGVRRLARWLSHHFNAIFESVAFHQCRVLVVPSQGLASEIADSYPECRGKIKVISNPVDLEKFRRPETFNIALERQNIHLEESDLVISFMALGDFSRKGLGLLIEALGRLSPDECRGIKILVVGGQPGEIETYREIAKSQNVYANIIFVGMQSDVRSYLWISDVFALPSSYETFSLAAFQAASAGLPVMVSKGLYGPEDLVVEGVNGWQVNRDVYSICEWMKNLLLQRDKLKAMGEEAESSVQAYSLDAFQTRWLELYNALLKNK